MSGGAHFYVRVPKSHRKLQQVLAAFPAKPQFYYSFRFAGNFLYVDSEQFERIKQYVTRARVDTSKLLKCWS